MAHILGMDTGGTYTDGVIIDASERKIIKKAKALTTKKDLTIGIKNCIDALGIDRTEDITMISLSTTLATNATVEGRGGRTALIYMGAEPEGEIPSFLRVKIKGRVDIMGRVVDDIDEAEAREKIGALKGKVDAVAVSGYAGVKNPEHELKIKRLAEELLGVPVVCAHELTSSLGFDQRTVTAVLNGRLISVIDDLLRSTKKVLEEKNIDGRIMIVKGDGTLMTEKSALSRPVETILSGPAASIIGGLALTGKKDGIVVDMGGTTTDIAKVKDGTVKIKEEGANVGGWHTRVKAAEISTFGIGGDSRIYIDESGCVQVGPQKVIPLCIAADIYPDLVHEMKSFRRSGDMLAYHPDEADCYMYTGKKPKAEVSGNDSEILEMLEGVPHSLTYIARKIGRDPETMDLSPLVEEGVLLRIGVTPTDILHVLGEYDVWSRKAAYAGTEILAKRLGENTSRFASDMEKKISRDLALTCIQAAADFEGEDISVKGSRAAMFFVERIFDAMASENIRLDMKLKKPLVAIGAPAGTWLVKAGKLLGAEVTVPEDADVANAYGAAVGQVTETVEMTVSIDGRKYVLNAPWVRMEYSSKEEAMFYAIHEGRKYIEHMLADAGCRRSNIEEKFSDIMVNMPDVEDTEGKENSVYMGTRILLQGTGDGMI